MSNFFLQPYPNKAQSTAKGVIAFKKQAREKARQVAVNHGIGALGSITKSQSTFTKVTKQPLPSKQDTRSLLFKQKDEVGRLMPTHRTRWCLCNKCKPDDAVGIKVKKTVKDKKATFTGLFRCDSVWTCPVCGQRILAQRGREPLTISL